MSLKSIKQKIRSVGKTRQVTRAMEAVSAVKMRKSQERALTARPFAGGRGF
jgi:F-type H+-transporting ATPase subunit gamma